MFMILGCCLISSGLEIKLLVAYRLRDSNAVYDLLGMLDGFSMTCIRGKVKVKLAWSVDGHREGVVALPSLL